MNLLSPNPLPAEVTTNAILYGAGAVPSTTITAEWSRRSLYRHRTERLFPEVPVRDLRVLKRHVGSLSLIGYPGQHLRGWVGGPPPG